MDNSPIGVFDSGMGGLSVWRELKRSLPEESLVYFGDGKNCPYGEKDAAQVAGFIKEGIATLVGAGVKMVVLACNTATMIGIKKLREQYDMPFVGMEPALKPAAETTKSGIVGVLATRASLDSEWFAALRERHSGMAAIVAAEGEGFVRIVEEGREETPEAAEAVRMAVAPLIDAGADKIVLGCTHYPFLAGRIAEAIGNRAIDIVDSAPAIVRRVEWLLDENGLRAAQGHAAEYEFMTAGDGAYLEKLRAKARLITGVTGTL